MNLIFVYGTLRKSQSTVRSGVLQDNGGEFVGEGSITGPWSRETLTYGLPALVKLPSPLDSPNTIQGEFWKVDDTLLSILDRIEGHPEFYCREQVPSDNGPAWVYFISKDYFNQFERHKPKYKGWSGYGI